jgi:hypothetical protein
MKSKQTAVEWLLENLISEPYSEVDFKYNAECWNKAEEMEKEQIMSAFAFGVYDGGGIIKKYKMSEEQYYNETFKPE